MRVGIATVQVPFIRGGAEDHTAGLVDALRRVGHEVDLITMPFRFGPVREVERSMQIWSTEDFGEMNGYEMERVICLRFPAYYLNHTRKVVWLLHQHRSVYDLWDTPFSGDLPNIPEGQRLRHQITRMDTESLTNSGRLFSNSRNVADRLRRFNGVESKPLYHPPKLADRIYNAPAESYIFYPSRLEGLKRQTLLVEAMKYVRTPMVALLAGDGGQKAELSALIDRLGVSEKVRLLGRISDDEMLSCYAHCTAVFFGPLDEDYGYITLEAMLAAKPVITCTDSGGPLEFVENGVTGYVVDPSPEEIGKAIDDLYLRRKQAADMGHAGLEKYCSLNITWENVLDQLLY